MNFDGMLGEQVFKNRYWNWSIFDLQICPSLPTFVFAV